MEELSAALQAKSTSCGDATWALEVCIKTLNEMRNDDHFKAFFEDVVEKSRELELVMILFYNDRGNHRKE